MTNRLRTHFEQEEAERIVYEQLRALADDIGRGLRDKLVERLGSELSSRVSVSLSFTPPQVTVAPANAPHSFPEQKER